MKKILTVLLILVAVQFGCTKLDTVLYDRVPPTDYVADPVLLMSPIYAPMRDFLDWSGWWFANELTGDGSVGPTRGQDWDDGGKWRALHQHTWDNNTEAVNSMWSRYYNGVIEANKFIEAQSALGDALPVKIAIAKAKVLRAYYYYLLIDNYKDVPYETRYEFADETPSRNFRQDIFAKITKDIADEAPIIPASTTKTGVTKGFAYSVLARLYLNAEVYTGTPQWAKAEQYADSVILIGQYSLESDPLKPFVTDNSNSPENIFVIPYDEDKYQGFNLHMRTLHYNSNLTFDMTAGPWNGFAAVYDHYNSYQDGDARKAGYFLVGQQYTASGAPITDQGAGGEPLIFNPFIPAINMDASYTAVQIRMSGARVSKFEIKKGAKDNLSNDFPLFRYADVLMMKAESMIRQGKNGDQYINPIRVRAGVAPFNNATLDDVLAERGREFFWEAHRRSDLIRFGKFNQAWWEKGVSSPDRNTFPIPQWAIDSNPKLAQPPVPIQ
ncbi:MAG: RagB/SusD family nutrient uptake outer membrane protein [Bacteroidales bacterium]|nr:RagB/SusD family nutrient uptake outer membrane protein [Bacteroidales bacterium]